MGKIPDYERALEYFAELSGEDFRREDFIDRVEGARVLPTIGPSGTSMIAFLISLTKPAKILDIGCAVGINTAAMAKAASEYGGEVTAIEINRRIAGTAMHNLQSAGVADSVKLLVSDANRAIEKLSPESFGMIVQDAHKPDYLPMLDKLIEILQTGGLLVSDDVLFPIMGDDHAEEIDEYNHALADHPRLKTLWMPLGDGVAVSLKLPPVEKKRRTRIFFD